MHHWQELDLLKQEEIKCYPGKVCCTKDDYKINQNHIVMFHKKVKTL